MYDPSGANLEMKNWSEKFGNPWYMIFGLIFIALAALWLIRIIVR